MRERDLPVISPYACPSCGEWAMVPGISAADMECQACGAVEAADEPGGYDETLCPASEAIAAGLAERARP